MARIVLFGASGYTGRLTARACVERGIRPVLAGRSPSKLQALSDAIDANTGYADTDHARLEYTSVPKGIAAAELDSGQREMLRALLSTYLDRVPTEVSPIGRYCDDETLDAVHVAWAGPTEPGAPHYYRLQGPRLLIEWDNTQRGANHAHSVWRDPTADFGLDVLAAHRAAHH